MRNANVLRGSQRGTLGWWTAKDDRPRPCARRCATTSGPCTRPTSTTSSTCRPASGRALPLVAAEQRHGRRSGRPRGCTWSPRPMPLPAPIGQEVELVDEHLGTRWSLRFFDPSVIPDLGVLARRRARESVRRTLGVAGAIYHLTVADGGGLSAAPRPALRRRAGQPAREDVRDLDGSPACAPASGRPGGRARGMRTPRPGPSRGTAGRRAHRRAGWSRRRGRPAASLPCGPTLTRGRPVAMTLSSVATAARILREFGKHSTQLGVSQLARRVGVGKSTAHRVLWTLVEEGLSRRSRRPGCSGSPRRWARWAPAPRPRSGCTRQPHIPSTSCAPRPAARCTLPSSTASTCSTSSAARVSAPSRYFVPSGVATRPT